MIETLGPVGLTLLALAVSTLAGYLPVRKLIEVREAKHELKHGSAGFIRTTSGWFVIVIWLALTWFMGTFCGDWFRSGSFEFAMDRGLLRLQILLEILAALGDD